MKKLLFLFYFLLLLPFKAYLDAPKNGTCHPAIAKLNNLDPQGTLSVEPIEFIEALQQSTNWTLEQKQTVIEFLPQLSPDQLMFLFKIISNLIIFHKKQASLAPSSSEAPISTIELLDPSFSEALLSATKKNTLLFNTNQLIHILYFYKNIGIKPDKAFIDLWRQAAERKKREFESPDRFLIHSLFKDLGIPSLHSPRDLNSDHTEQPSN